MRSAEEIAGEIIPDSDGFGEWPHYVADRRPLIAKAIREARAEGRAEAWEGAARDCRVAADGLKALGSHDGAAALYAASEALLAKAVERNGGGHG